MLSQNARGRTSARYEDLFFQKEKISFSSLSKKKGLKYSSFVSREMENLNPKETTGAGVIFQLD